MQLIKEKPLYLNFMKVEIPFKTKKIKCKYNFLEYEWKDKLRFVRIYFGTSAFNKITKDNANNFWNMLSAVGGTMGLLTGFSIMSAIEILFFIFKSIVGSLMKIS